MPWMESEIKNIQSILENVFSFIKLLSSNQSKHWYFYGTNTAFWLVVVSVLIPFPTGGSTQVGIHKSGYDL